jgi:UDP-glucose 4-epimerase
MSYRVTGGAGFIGSHLAEALSKCGKRVRIFDNLSTGSRDQITNQVELVAGD